jgi:putative inorganic carbon (hco3(-)) transporter
MALSSWPRVWPVLAGFALACLWPLTAYAVSPLALPALLLVSAAVAAIAWRPEYGVALTLVLAPFLNVSIGGGASAALKLPPEPLQVLLPMLSIGLALYGFAASEGTARSRPRWLIGAVLGFCAVSLASSSQALEPRQSVQALVLLFTAAAIFLAVVQICRERRQLVVVAVGAMTGLLLAAVQGIVQYLSGSGGPYGVDVGGDVVTRVQGSFVHPNRYGVYLAVLIPLGVALCTSRHASGRVRALGGIAAALAIPALVFTFNRGSIVGLVVGSLVWLAFVRPRIAAFAGTALVVAAVTIAPAALKERVDPETGGDDVTLRSDIWRGALEIYSEHPVLGAGVNNFQAAYGRLPSAPTQGYALRLLDQAGEFVPPSNAHNAYLNILAEQGILGGAAFLLLAYVSLAVIYRGCRVRDPLGRAICVGTGAGVMTWALNNLLNVALFTAVTLPLLGLVGVAAAYVALDGGSVSLRPRLAWRRP